MDDALSVVVSNPYEQFALLCLMCNFHSSLNVLIVNGDLAVENREIQFP